MVTHDYTDSRHKLSDQESVDYRIIAGLTNTNGMVYLPMNFLVPTVAPEHPPSKYIVWWDMSAEVYRVALRGLLCIHTEAGETGTSAEVDGIINPVSSEGSDTASPEDSPLMSSSSASSTRDDKEPLSPKESHTRGVQPGGESALSITMKAADRVSTSPNDTLTAFQTNDPGEKATASFMGLPSEEHETPRRRLSTSSIESKDALDDPNNEPPTKGQIQHPSHTLSPFEADDPVRDIDEIFLESPVKACNIVRPCAPTPARGKTHYLRDFESIYDDSYYSLEESHVSDTLDLSQISFTYDCESSKQIPPLDRANVTLSVSADALDLGLGYNSAKIHTHLDWLHLILQPDFEKTINGYSSLSQESIHKLLGAAACVVTSIDIKHNRVLEGDQRSSDASDIKNAPDMDIDLDAIFGGQGATDLEDDQVVELTAPAETVGTAENVQPTEISEPREVVEAISYASDLLECKASGLPLSEFIPTGAEADNAVRTTFTYKGWSPSRALARLTASEAAYFYFSQGLDTLKRNGLASRRYLSEATDRRDWFFLQASNTGGLPYDPRSVKSHSHEDIDNKPEEAEKPEVSSVSRLGSHYNYLGETIAVPSSTPASVSYYIQTAAARKHIRHAWSREGVILAQANKYIDVVWYDGPLEVEELAALRGTDCQNKLIGHALKVNDRRGSFGDLHDGETTIMDFEKICDEFLDWNQDSYMQRPYLMNKADHLDTPSRMMSMRIKPLVKSFTKVDAEGLVMHWNNRDDNKCRSYSKLWMAQSAQEDGQPSDIDVATSEVQEPVNGCTLSRILEKLEDEVDKQGYNTTTSQISEVEEERQPRPGQPGQLPLKTSAGDNLVEDTDGSQRSCNTGEIVETGNQDKANEDEDEEYSPLQPCIQGLQAAREDWQPEEMSQDEALRYAEDIFRCTFGSGDNCTVTDADDSVDAICPEAWVDTDGSEHPNSTCEECEENHSPLEQPDSSSSEVEEFHSSGATTPPTPILQSSDLSISPHITSSMEHPPPSPSITCPPTDLPIPHQPSSPGNSKHASTYLSIIFGIGIILSLW
ncbi:MAG: hypothetical protein Q9219_006409 [cf. Caloplaca sp. 3 TL-2023]